MNNFFRKPLDLVGNILRHSSNPLKNVVTNRIAVVRTPKLLSQNNNILKLQQFSRNSSYVKKLQNVLPRTLNPNLLVAHRDIHDSSSTATPKKRIGFRKRRSEHHEKLTENGYYNVTAFATSEEYNLEKLVIALKTQDLYEPKKFFNSDDSSVSEPDVLYAVAKYQVGKEPRDIFFFREGTVIMWNFSDMESSNILGFLKNYEQVFKV